MKVPVASTELIHAADKVLIAPATGRFRTSAPSEFPAVEDFVARGDLIGFIDTGTKHVPVSSRFSGWFKSYLVVQGEPVESGQPLAHMRSH